MIAIMSVYGCADDAYEDKVNEKENKDVYMVALRDDDETLIGYYEKHEYRNRETLGLYEAIK